MEVWKDIEGCNGKYQISNTGFVKSVKRRGRPTERILAVRWHIGYNRLNLFGRGVLVHRLVAIAFIPNPDNYPYINHKDGNKLNNNVGNLEWVTPSMNQYHAYRTGLKKAPPMKGQNHPVSKLKDTDVLDIKKRLQNREKQKDIAKIYGVHRTTICLIKLNKNWSHI